MLRISDSAPLDSTSPHYLCIDKKKRQITLTDPTTIPLTITTQAADETNTSVSDGAGNTTTNVVQERGPMVAAPKIFAFDNLFTNDDVQTDVCSSALSEVIPAVLEGTDGCLLTLGYPGAGEFSKSLFKNLGNSQVFFAIPLRN